MKNVIRKVMFVLIGLAVLFCQSFAGTDAITVDSVVGEVAAGKIVSGQRIGIYLRLVHIPDSPPYDVVESANSFIMYSLDSATWSPGVFVDTSIFTFPPSTLFDSSYFGQWIDPQQLSPWTWIHVNRLYIDARIESHSDHDNDPISPDLFGEGVDTVRYGGEALAPYSTVPGIFYYDETAWLLQLDSVKAVALGKSICLDALNENSPNPNWRWVTHWEGNFDTLAPTWDGPYCYEIVADCCEGFRGNINLDLQDTIDISDLTSMVGWMFKPGAAPPCMLEADVNGDSTHDILDLTGLVGYMFKSGPAPAGCP